GASVSARPMPRLAPVTRATAPLILCAFMVFFLASGCSVIWFTRRELRCGGVACLRLAPRRLSDVEIDTGRAFSAVAPQAQDFQGKIAALRRAHAPECEGERDARPPHHDQ